MSAEDRRDQVIRAAVAEFSKRGLEGTSTSDIAKRVGVSQPYLFRLFPTKKALFIAACTFGSDRIKDVFTKAADGLYGVEALSAMGAAYQEMLMQDSELLGMQLQQFAACADEEVQQSVRRCMQSVWQHVDNLTGVPVAIRVDFFAKGMLCNMIAAMGGAAGLDSSWQPVLDALADTPQLGEREITPEDEAYAEYVAASIECFNDSITAGEGSTAGASTSASESTTKSANTSTNTAAPR
jgi:AcrR family transcriptional regulator